MVILLLIGVAIPMFGMIESLNLGTSSGIVLYEVAKQRREYQSKYRLGKQRGKRAAPLPTVRPREGGSSSMDERSAKGQYAEFNAKSVLPTHRHAASLSACRMYEAPFWSLNHVGRPDINVCFASRCGCLIRYAGWPLRAHFDGSIPTGLVRLRQQIRTLLMHQWEGNLTIGYLDTDCDCLDRCIGLTCPIIARSPRQNRIKS